MPGGRAPRAGLGPVVRGMELFASRTRSASQGSLQYARHMNGLAPGAVTNLLTAADAVRNNRGVLAAGAHGGEEMEFGHLHRDVVVLSVKTK